MIGSSDHSIMFLKLTSRRPSLTASQWNFNLMSKLFSKNLTIGTFFLCLDRWCLGQLLGMFRLRFYLGQDRFCLGQVRWCLGQLCFVHIFHIRHMFLLLISHLISETILFSHIFFIILLSHDFSFFLFLFLFLLSLLLCLILFELVLLFLKSWILSLKNCVDLLKLFFWKLLLNWEGNLIDEIKEFFEILLKLSLKTCFISEIITQIFRV